MVFMLTTQIYPFRSPLGSQLGDHLGCQNFTCLPEIPLKRVLGGLWAGLLRVLEKDLKLESSWDRFFIDFRRVLGAAGGAKTRFSLESGTHFHIFGFLKIRYLLDPQKPRFRLRFGSQVGLLNRPCCHQEAPGTPKETIFGAPNFDPKKRH